MDDTTAERIHNILPLLNERQRRLYLGQEAKALGRYGVSQVSKVSGISRGTIKRGLNGISSDGYRDCFVHLLASSP